MTSRPAPAKASVLALLALLVPSLLVLPPSGAPDPLWAAGALAAVALLGDIVNVRYSGGLKVTSIDIGAQAAGVVLGPAGALLVGVSATSASFAYERLNKQVYALPAFMINLAVNTAPSVAMAWVIAQIGAHPDAGSVTLFAGAALLSLVCTAASVLLYGALVSVRMGTSGRELIVSTTRDMGGQLLVPLALVVVIVMLYDLAPASSIVVAIVSVAIYGYMSRVVKQANDRLDQVAQMSWGMISSLVRTVAVRDPATARHCAATATFARDLAERMGYSAEQQNLAHIAGLVHDLGRFAMVDDAVSGYRELSMEEWDKVLEHPAIGADLLQEIAGPLALVVAQHHERVDGKGYPNRLPAAEIHPIAKIVAVAEVYDTLTGPDTYREPQTSFQALQELQRVAGTQLDEAVVDALAQILAGRDTEYRHAADVDLLEELNQQRGLYLHGVLGRTP